MIKTIGSILVSMGALTEQQLAQATQKAAESEQPLEQYLVDNKVITAEQRAKAYAEQVSAPFIEQITEKMADPTVLVKVPLSFLRRNSVIPVLIKEKVVIVTAEPTQYQPIDELRLLLGQDASVGVSTQKIIIDSINRYYPIEGTTEMIEELAEQKELGEEGLAFEEIEEKEAPRRAPMGEELQEKEAPRRAPVGEELQEKEAPRRAPIGEELQEKEAPRRAPVGEELQEKEAPRRAPLGEELQEKEAPRRAPLGEELQEKEAPRRAPMGEELQEKEAPRRAPMGEELQEKEAPRRAPMGEELQE